LTERRANPIFVILLLSVGLAIGYSYLQTPVYATLTLSLSPPIGTTGTPVVVSGTGFWTGANPDATCTISGSNPSLIFGTSGPCTITSGSIDPGFTFTVGPVSTGSYTVTVTGQPHGDSVSATFTVTAAFVPTIVVSPQDGPLGTKVTLQGTGFSTNDNTCQISSNAINLIVSPSCSISSGKVTASFTVGAAPSYGISTITVTGSTGDSADTNFLIDSPPVLTFSPASGQPPGTTIQVTLLSGTQFSSGDTSCTISSTPGGIFQSSACHIGGAGKDLSGTFFVIAAVASGGSYQIQVKGNLGDVGTGLFTVTITPSLTLNPAFGSPGQGVSFTARGLLTTDTSCTVTATTAPSGGNLMSSPSCSISGGTATGSFTVSGTATADGSPYTVTVTGNLGGDSVASTFTVVPIIYLSPNVGPSGTSVSITGYGFSSTATTCGGTASPSGLTSFMTCYVAQVTAGTGSAGQVTGSFTVGGYASAFAGVYVVTIGDDLGDTASATFTVGAPTAQITISPNIGIATPPGPTSAGVSGFGFSVSDTSCTLTAGGSLIASSTCNISGGTVGGSFTVSGSAAPGIYLITVTGFIGSPPVANDFASNYFEVASTTATTITTTSYTSSTSTTSFSTSITTTNTFSTLTTTTFTFTGVSTWTSWFFTSTTTTGQSTSTQTVSTTATSSMIPVTTTQTSTVTVISTHTFGMAATPSFSSHASISEQAFGLLAVLALIVPMMLRRLLV
jgi:hypothetical protein